MGLPPSSVRRWDRCAAQGHSLFACGTLQFPEVLEVLIGRVPSQEPAAAPGCRVAALPGRIYPGLVPKSKALTRGVVLKGLTAGEWEILDAFEDDEYDLRATQLTNPQGPAWTYIWTAAVAQDDWYPDHFVTTRLPRFVTHCAEWRRGLEVRSDRQDSDH
ncbi:gamma-glutamylcyclotransferase family protein [Nocardia sp. CA-128927]|uniref:gamma-glutamylcyclotransferase family protein n=1 Tax=Nocardia sp. CA-128927 TaxID=3239975 RepID=UPI003D9692C9